MTKRELKENVCRAIDARRETIVSIGRTILANPELGFKEEKTAALVKRTLEDMGLSYRDGIAITGVRTDLKGKQAGPCVAVMGELDAVVCPAHLHADPITGAAHACGHNMQVAGMLGVAMGLVDTAAMAHLAGRVSLMAVPAEEFVELEYRESLRDKGKIRYFGGKQELVRIGELDDVDMAMMVHGLADAPEPHAIINTSSSAFVGKTVVFRGMEAHAGAFPDQGINALNAACAALMCIHAQRETFRDEDGVRVHPILTKGGDLVNIVPADVRMETYVRALTMDAAIDANDKVNRAILGAAYAVGAGAEISETPGYLPLSNCGEMMALYADNIAGVVGRENIVDAPRSGGSTDMGDISCIMPAIHPYMGGFTGGGHSKDYAIVDEEAAYIAPAKAMAMTVIDLLWHDGAEAKRICKAHSPVYTKAGYLALLEKLQESKSVEMK